MQKITLKNNEPNVLSMENWKKYLSKNVQFQDHEKYLAVLSFHQLISEATETLSKLKSDSLDSKLITRSKLLLQEFNRRMDSLSGDFSNSLEGIRSKVDSKIKELDHKLLK
jgi:hypothetical protein